MIHEQQQEQASLYVLGTLAAAERDAFEREMRANAELRQFVRELQRSTGLLAMTVPQFSPPKQLRNKVLERIHAQKTPGEAKPPIAVPAAFKFIDANQQEGWKQLPVPGAWIKLLSLERERGYAVLLGKLEAGARYPAHVNAGPEDFYILTGDLHIGDRRLGAGDFHHAAAGTTHEVNHSVEGCTLIAVLTTDDPLVAFAMA